MFFEEFLTLTKGRWYGQPFELLDFQREIIRNIFGTLNDDGTRQYRTVYIEMPKKNGKSPIAAGIALYLLVADGELGAEIALAAADKEQAGIVFTYAMDMANNSPELAEIVKPIASRKRLVVHGTGSYLAALSADVETKHGPSWSGIIVDELHAQPNRQLWDVLTMGTAARDQPLVVAITTAGYDRKSICWEQHEYALRCIRDPEYDPTFYGVIFAAEPDDDWTDESVWYKANPALGIFRSLEQMRAECRKAQRMPASQNTFRRLYLNQWTTQRTRWMSLDVWDKTAGDVVEADFRECIAYGGLDLANVTDLASLALVFPDEDNEYVDVIWRYWCPEDSIIERSESAGVPYDRWAQEGWIKATPGNVIDHRVIIDDIAALRAEFELYIAEIAYDRWGASMVVNELQERAFTVIPFGQGFASMSGPTKTLQELTLRRRIRHGGNPVSRWCMDNVVSKEDAAGNIKLDRGASTEKIDGIIALVMGLDRATRHGLSVYETDEVKELTV